MGTYVTTHIALLGWPLLVLMIFLVLRPRHAVIVAYIGAWMFLPHYGYSLPGLPDYTKVTAATLGVLAGMLVFDPGRLVTFRPAWYDLPILIWCVAPFLSSITNGLGVYDGLSAVFENVFLYGLPYLIGRCYFNDLQGLRELAIGVFIGALVYVPLCLIEMRLSPQLHNWLYGFHQVRFINLHRYGGWKPKVFMQNGLMVAMWMAMGSLAGFWLWWSGSMVRTLGIHLRYLVPLTILTTVLCKSIGALGLMMMGITALLAVRTSGRNWPVWIIVLLVPTYMFVRTTNLWTGDSVLAMTRTVFGAQREKSLSTRFENEDQLTEKALQKPWFGWGRWGRSRIKDDRGVDKSLTDGLWVISMGQTGLVGTVSLTLAILLPTILFLLRFGGRAWSHPWVAPAAVMSTTMALWMIDNLLNAMVNPVYLLVAGGLIALAPLRRRSVGQPLTARNAVRRSILGRSVKPA